MFGTASKDPLAKEKEKPKLAEPQKRSFQRLFDVDQDNVEIKKLDIDDLEDTVKVMRKCAFDVTEKEVKTIINYGISFGCYDNRMLIGAGLAWPANFDIQRKQMVTGEPNAIYLEDPAVLLAYEGRGLRRILVNTRQKTATEKNYKYAVAYISEDLPRGNISDHIKEAGSQLEKLYLSEGFEFFRTETGIIAMKRLTAEI